MTTNINSTTSLYTDNPEIIQFYKTNKHLDFTTMNLILINILRNLSTNLNETVNATINSKILEATNELTNHVKQLKLDFLIKLQDTKLEYISAVKDTITATNQAQLTSILDKTTETLISKTTNTLTELLPKSHKHHYERMEASIREHLSNINIDTKTLLE